MIEIETVAVMAVAVAAAGAGWLLRRKHRRRVPTPPPVPGIPGMARRPAGEGRWRIGRVYVEPGAARWVPNRGEPVALSDARATGVRPPSVREGMSINPGSRIVAFAHPDGATMEIAVMALDLRELLDAVPRSAQDAPETT
ncbi:hypothetical protein MTF65_09475 [Streptomyces sp. APSN-46.1]|uniref:hypothetical protein n=1 Tax=Streptomyces sp. APSN-46.1 TaxID=2929049 RepID=UPI001FB42FC6|nr:hypothetical protein [Streptomyces sp. APSN-46.1]MCJ1677561.1 hypothetical protein [Streptomyces sp. APSN-46.1]